MTLSDKENAIHVNVMGVSPALKVKERVSVISEGLMKESFTLTNEEYALLCRARDLESPRTGRASLFKETSVMAVQDYLEKRDPVQKALRAKVRVEKKEILVMKANLEKEVRKDHRKESANLVSAPVSEGGNNNPENLTLLCSQHHDLVHQMELPLGETCLEKGHVEGKVRREAERFRSGVFSL